MRALFIHGEKLSEVDGNYYSTGNLNEKVIKRYLKNFIKLTIIARKEYDIKYKRENLSRVNIENTNIIFVKEFNNLNFKHLMYNKKILEEEIKKTDIVILRMPSILSNLSVEICKKYKKKYFIEVVGCTLDALINHGSIKAKLLAPISYYRTRRAIRESKNVLYVTSEFLQKRYPNKNNTIACSDVYIKEINTDIYSSRINKKIDIKDEIVIGMIGTLSCKYKGHEIAFKAISLLKENYNIKLKLVGYGKIENWKDTIHELNIRRNIEFIGSLDNEKINKWLDSIDIYIQPSYTEGLPRAIIEAMSRGCPVIGSNVGGIPELVLKENLFANKNYSYLAKCIENIILDRNLYKRSIDYSIKKSKEFLPNKLDGKRREFIENLK
ncbi:glycosyltransferase [Clostridium thermobutyricum]